MLYCKLFLTFRPKTMMPQSRGSPETGNNVITSRAVTLQDWAGQARGTHSSFTISPLQLPSPAAETQPSCVSQLWTCGHVTDGYQRIQWLKETKDAVLLQFGKTMKITYNLPTDYWRDFRTKQNLAEHPNSKASNYGRCVAKDQYGPRSTLYWFLNIVLF